MKERIETFLATADSPQTRDVTELKAIYFEITGESPKCSGVICISKMLIAVRKYYTLNFTEAKPEPKRKLQLKPGNHAFSGTGPAIHNNDNCNEKQLAWYLKHYPHIKDLLIK